ncbi:MAG: TonB-dependent receptor [Acidobacteria bacterium]|nr:TonB-dependent receptor [Acidobacteriota bacterium]
MRGRGFSLVVAMLAVCVLASTHAFAQGGGASTTGSINGKVADSSGAVLPGVTVTAGSPSLMGVQTTVSDAGGNYRFPALPPGTYTVTFELAGFNTLKRENIQIAMGFTAAVNVELAVASLQETVTVTGASPVIDTSSTRVQQNFKLEALQEIPNARDMWSLLAVTPAVTMSRIDVGGNRAGTQTGYTAYGYSGQNRVLVEGINTTEGTSGAGFYFDYGSFEEVFLGTIAQGAEMPTPGVQSQFLGKSGGNKFQGEIYQDYERNSFQGANIPADVIANKGIREHSNEIEKYRDFNLNVGGPIRKDKVWWYFSHRDQKNAVQQPNFIGPIAGTTFDTRLWNPSGKVTYQVNQNNKLIGYYQWGQKIQPTRLPIAANTYTSLDATWTQNSGSWVYKGEWNGTLSNKLYAEARYGVFGYYFPLEANTDTTAYYIVDSGKATALQGGDRKGQTDRQRRQATGSLTYFKDGWGGTHNFKLGGELLLETGWYGRTQGASGNIRENLNNGVAQQIIAYFPTATHLGSLGDGPNGNLLSVDKLDTYDAFFSDQYTFGRATLNLGLRWDYYKVWTPEQQQLANTIGPLSIPAVTFPETTYVTWNSIAPRVGVTYDLRGTGKSVIKVNYGFYRFNPGVGIAANANPNQDAKSATYTWTDTKVCTTCKPGDGIYQVGEEGAQTAAALAGNIKVDPNLAQPYSHQATGYFEQELSEGVGARVGFVYNAVRNQVNTYQTLRPASAYTVAFPFVDIGLDGVRGTADDQTLTFYGVPTASIGNFPNTQTVSNNPDNGTFKTIEFSLTKRQSHNYSVSGGVGYTWHHDFPGGFPNTPNGPTDYDYTSASFKATGTYTFPLGIFTSASYRFQRGSNYARTLSVSAPASCACTFSAATGSSLTSTTVYVGQYGDFRQDNISVLDLRIEKTVNLGSAAKVRLFGDIFNLTNQYAAETISRATGPAFQNPTAILGPRTGRVGFRFIW